MSAFNAASFNAAAAASAAAAPPLPPPFVAGNAAAGSAMKLTAAAAGSGASVPALGTEPARDGHPSANAVDARRRKWADNAAIVVCTCTYRKITASASARDASLHNVAGA